LERDIIVCFRGKNDLPPHQSATELRNIQMKTSFDPIRPRPTPEEIASLMRRARLERAQAIRSMFVSSFSRRQSRVAAGRDALAFERAVQCG
jgi:hypothetical protein